jgi:hypothetical protein
MRYQSRRAWVVWDSRAKRLLSGRIVALAILGLALLEGATIMQSFLRPTTAALVVTAGVLAAIVLWRVIPNEKLMFVAGSGLVLPWVLLYIAFLVQFDADSVSVIVFHVGLAIPFATAALAIFIVAARPRRSLWREGAAAALAIAVGFLAAGARAPWLNDPRPPARFAVVDEVRGTYGGVGIGDTPTEMRAVMGPIEPLGENDSFRPTGAQDYSEGPWSHSAGGGFAYPDVAFWLPPDSAKPSGAPGSTGLISGFELTSPGAKTLRGLKLGDDLAEAAQAYPQLTCGMSDRGEYGETDYCMGWIAGERFLYFGGDPITALTVSRAPVTP